MAFKPWGSGSPALTARQVPGTLASGQGLQSVSSTCPQSLVSLSPPLPPMSSNHLKSVMAATAATKALAATSLLCVPRSAHPIHKDHKWGGSGTPHSGGSMGMGAPGWWENMRRATRKRVKLTEDCLEVSCEAGEIAHLGKSLAPSLTT